MGASEWRVKRSGTAVAESGERVMDMTRGPNRERQGSFDTPCGVVRASTFKRLGEQERWSADGVLSVKGSALQPDPRREGEDAHIRIVADRPEERAAPPPPQDAPPAIRIFYV